MPKHDLFVTAAIVCIVAGSAMDQWPGELRLGYPIMKNKSLKYSVKTCYPAHKYSFISIETKIT